MSDHIPYAEYERFVGGLFYRNGDLSKDFAHAVFGLAEELRELDAATQSENVVEECGDLMFFAAAAHIVLKELLRRRDGVESMPASVMQQLVDADDLTLRAQIAHLVVGADGDTRATRLDLLVGVAKKWVGYGHAPLAADIPAIFQAAERLALRAVAARLAPSSAHIYQTCIRANIAKLRARYPGGFTLKSSIERDLQKEHEALESVAHT